MEGEIYYPGYTLEREFSNFIKVWVSVVVSLCYCHFSAKLLPKGMTRLFSFIPIFALFFALPLKLHSVILCSITGFIVAWISNFKLLLLAFGKGPLSDPSLSLSHFVAMACFPVKIPQKKPPINSLATQTSEGISHCIGSGYPGNPFLDPKKNPRNSLKSQNRVHPYPLDEDGHSNNQNTPPSQNPNPRTTKKGDTSSGNYYAIKGVLATFFILLSRHSDRINPNVMLVIYWFEIYFPLEVLLAAAAAAAQVFGLEFEPAFNNPFLSTSVQDFWGRRWNLVVSQTLRSTVYEPALPVSARLIGRKWASLPAVMCTFLVSALMHEIVFYYMGRMRPTWEVTWLFIFHGACVVVDIWIKKVFEDRWRLPRWIATPLTLLFVMGTGCWWFIPQLLRCKLFVRSSEEIELLGAFVKNFVGRSGKFYQVMQVSME